MRHARRSTALAAALTALAALAALPVQAQVFRCTGADGKTLYSDQPCSARSRSALIEAPRTQQEIAAERELAAQAEERKQRARSAEREQQLLDARLQQQERQLQPAPQHAAPRAPGGGDAEACRAARKELEFVSSIRTVPQDEKRLRTNAAITNVNAACGSSTPLMQEPPRVVVHPRSCRTTGGVTYCH